MIIKNTLYYSVEYKRVKIRNSYTVVYIDDCGCLKCVPASAIVCKCVYIATDGIQTYIVIFPNQLLSD